MHHPAVQEHISDQPPQLEFMRNRILDQRKLAYQEISGFLRKNEKQIKNGIDDNQGFYNRSAFRQNYNPS
jgi:oligoendopeptidase F